MKHAEISREGESLKIGTIAIIAVTKSNDYLFLEILYGIFSCGSCPCLEVFPVAFKL